MEKEVKKYLAQILCILFAVGLWLFVTLTEDPEMQVWVRNVPIAYHGTDGLPERELAFVSRETPETVNVKVAGRKSVLRRLRDSDVRASVNYAAIESAGKHTLPVSITLLENNLRISKVSVDAVECETDMLVTVEKTIFITSSGAESLGIHDFAASPQTVQMTGPKRVLDTLRPSVFVDLTGGDAATQYTVSLTDQSGERYDGDSVTLHENTVEIFATRALPIEIEAANVPEGKEIKEVVCTPETADIRAALPALLSADAARGAYSVWVDFSASPAKSGQVRLLFPEGVQVLGPYYAEAEFHLK